ncbi:MULTISPECIES: serine/threonine-protein kinase [Nonomuraea]|uniref:Serine/threonine-protein kinase n=2 Tax=Nonomuraea TaxID=83681 RepID=A0ABW1C4Y7_9ACTN|nr:MULTISPECIES: serine/threonine-protein kinase [Nonomuraea]MDA0644282.1 serine/threonine-protein kinase [Nonomuraea ferruginea]TXK35496.1 serine/threonine protein kinase [Nonomuraea sp. C10]
MSLHHPSRPSGGAWAAAVVWAALPLFSCGLATPFTIGFAAFWLRSVGQLVAAGLYTVNVGVFIIAITMYDQVDDIPEPMSTIVSLMFVAGWIGSVIHSGILVPAMARARSGRPAMAGAPSGPPGTYPPPNVHQRTTTPTAHRRPGEPDWIGHYRVLQPLGRGGQGAVYLAMAPNGVRVAVKVLHDLVDETARARFAREVDAARRVATFSTARVLDVSITGQSAYIVSEYVEGPSLEQLVRRHGPRDEDGLTRLALSTSGALAAIHKAGVVHRDFKPSNVLIGHDGPRVIDFGIARALDQVTVTSGKMVGTPAYMSPEQLSGTPVGPPSDVFSWAVTMMFAATGRPAFGEDTVPAIFNRVLTFHPDLSPLPQSLRGVVGVCLAKRPEDRPSASDVMLAIVH